jgi:hypothetical protein
MRTHVGRIPESGTELEKELKPDPRELEEKLEARTRELAEAREQHVVSTYRLWLLHELFKGAISVEEYERSELALSDFIVARVQDKPHWARLRAGAAIEAVMKMTVIG